MAKSELASSSVPAPLSIRALLILSLLTRLVTDTGVQLFFPFLPVIAAGLGVTAVTMGRLVSVRSSMGLLSPFFGVLADRRGYRFVMRLGLLLMTAGYLLVALSPNVWTAVLGMILAGLGSFSFVPTLQAYLSARLPYHRRARGLAIPEYGWALSGILGLWLMGELIALTNWRVPLLLIAAALFAGFWIYRRLPPVDDRPASAAPAKQEATLPLTTRLRGFFWLGDNWPSATAVLSIAGLVMFAGMVLFINYGSWLVDRFALGPAMLGRAALFLGLADLAGSGLVSLIGDQLGKRRLVLLGTIAAVGGYALLPQMGGALLTAVVGLLLVRFAFELSVVANLTLLSEQLAAARGKIMALGAATALLGSTIAGLIGPWVYERQDIQGVALLAGSAMAVAALLTWLVAREQEEPESFA